MSRWPASPPRRRPSAPARRRRRRLRSGSARPTSRTSSTSGNTKTSSIGGGLELIYNPKPWLFTLKGAYLKSVDRRASRRPRSKSGLAARVARPHRAHRRLCRRRLPAQHVLGHRQPVQLRRRRGLQALQRARAVPARRGRRRVHHRAGHRARNHRALPQLRQRARRPELQVAVLEDRRLHQRLHVPRSISTTRTTGSSPTRRRSPRT